MTELNPLTMTIELLGGLALFLYGMEKMTDGLKAAAGQQMNALLAKLTGNAVLGAITGAIVTAVIQSSSVTTVLVVGFVSAGIMTLVQSVGVIFGANVGTTVTAQIVAFNTTALAYPLIAIGFFMSFVWKQGVVRHYLGCWGPRLRLRVSALMACPFPPEGSPSAAGAPRNPRAAGCAGGPGGCGSGSRRGRNTPARASPPSPRRP